MNIAEATVRELDDWDARTVDVSGGNVYQSRTWASQRARLGWRPRFLVFDDGYRLLSLERPWRLVGGAGAYLARGPVAAGEPVTQTAARLVAAANYLASQGIDVVASDAEIETASGYPGLIEAAGFRLIEEVQPSRHRVALALEPGAGEPALFGAFATSIRQRVRHAERSGLRVIRWDVRHEAEPNDGFEAPPVAEEPRRVQTPADSGMPAIWPAAPVFDRFYDLLLSTAARRGFGLGPRQAFVDWSCAALDVGHLVYLEVRSPTDDLLGGATFYRHGGRLTYSNSGDRVDLRHSYPGVIHLLLWRAIQLALRDGLVEMDLAGVDVTGSRREPVEGDEMYGLYAFKRSFGATWRELSGNHELVVRPVRYALGRLTGKLPLPNPGSRPRAAHTTDAESRPRQPGPVDG